MRALQRISVKPRLSSLPLAATRKPILLQQPTALQQQQHDNDDSNKAITTVTNTPHVALAAAATAALTPAGYAISPLGVTVLSNMPLVAFAFVQVSGLSPIRQILKDKATGDLSVFPFVSLFTNCAVWSLYGLLQQDQTVLVANVVGTAFGAAYTLLFARYTHQSMMKYYAGSAGILAVFLSSPIWAPMVGTTAPTVLGTFGMSTAVILMASPLAVVGTVIKQKSTAAMPLPVSLAMTMNGICWGSYGWFVTNDMYVYLPNILGAAAGFIQLSLFAMYS